MGDFSFEKWRSRYMRWMHNKKSRVMDFFRKIDTDGDGQITRQEFIDGIIKSSKSAGRISACRRDFRIVKCKGENKVERTDPPVCWVGIAFPPLDRVDIAILLQWLSFQTASSIRNRFFEQN